MTRYDREPPTLVPDGPESIRINWSRVPSMGGEELRVSIRQLEDELERSLRELTGELEKLLLDERELMRSLELRFRLRTRRLAALSKEASKDTFVEQARTELHVLTQRVREIAMARAQRRSGFTWQPGLLFEAMVGALGRLPDLIDVEREVGDEFRLPKQEGGPLGRWWRRLSYRVSTERPRSTTVRRLPLRQLMTWHMLRASRDGLEGIATLVVQAEAAIADKLWVIYQIAAQEFEAMISDPGQLDSAIEGLWIRVQEQIKAAEAELRRYEVDIGRRVVAAFTQGVESAKAELPDIGTVRLPARARLGLPLIEGHREEVAALDARFAEAREAAKRTFVAYALRVELYGYRFQGWWSLIEEVEALGEVVANRFARQVERVRAGLDEVVASLEVEEKIGHTGELPRGEQLLDERIEKAFDALVKIVGKGLESLRQGRDLLAEVKDLSKAIDDWASAADDLSAFYRIPLHPIARSEWRLPASPQVVEVPFAKLVRQYVQTEIAPGLLELVAEQTANLQRVDGVMLEAERVARLGAEQFEERLDELDEFDWHTPDRGRTRNVLLAACLGARDGLLAMEKDAGEWAGRLVAPARTALATRLDELEASFTGTKLEQALQRDAEREPEDRGRASSATSRSSPWDRRVATVWRALGLPRDQASAGELGARLSPPRPTAEVPLYYRRLFAPQDTWVAEAAGFDSSALRYLGDERPSERLKTLVILAPELPSRRALVASVGRVGALRRARRFALSSPTDAGMLRRSFAEVPAETAIVLSGFSWMVSAEAGGFDGVRALCELVLARRGGGAVVLDADALVWEWAGGAAPLEQVFADRIEVPRLGPERLEEVLVARHQLSGMKLAYFGEESDPRARERYFADLHQSCDGLLPVALAQWLASVTAVVDEGDSQTLHLGSPPPSPHRVLRLLPEEILHVAYLTLRQGWMTGDVLSGLLGCRAATAEAMLAQMVGTGLLERHASGAHIHRRHLSGAMRTVLEEREWL